MTVVEACRLRHPAGRGALPRIEVYRGVGRVRRWKWRLLYRSETGQLRREVSVGSYVTVAGAKTIARQQARGLAADVRELPMAVLR